jgi:hypothetical protein
MRRYRVFFMNSEGKVEDERAFQTIDDVTAIRLADGWRNDRRAEVWNTHQRIARLP